MPVAFKTTRYGCVHRCGIRRKINAEQMATHEAVCWMNIENKTCRTCKFENYFQPPFGDGWIRMCDNKKGQKILDSKSFDLVNEKSDHVKPLPNCKYWIDKNNE